MNVQNPNETPRGRLQLSWVEVRDNRGRSRMEAHWTLVPRPITGGAAQAA